MNKILDIAAWCVLIILRLLSCGPYAMLRPLGRFGARLGRGRLDVADVNLAIAFPDLDDAERRSLRDRHLDALGDTLAAIFKHGFASAPKLREAGQVVGMAHLEKARSRGRGVILLAPHFIAQPLGVYLLSQDVDILAMYKKPGNGPFHSLYRWVIRQDTDGNPLAAWLFTRSGRGGIELVEHRGGLKPVFRWLRSGGVFYYLPDQDLGRRQAVFAPFFGVEAATVAAVDRFVRATDAAVLPCVTLLEDGGRFTVEVGAPMEPDWQTPREFAIRMNQMIEKQVYANPEQYFWLHKRFKTRPPGAPGIYR